MKKDIWKNFHGIYDIDMTLIETVVEESGKVTEVENPPLDYAIIKIVIKKD